MSKKLTKLEKKADKLGFELIPKPLSAESIQFNPSDQTELMETRTIQGGHPSDAATAEIWGLHAYGNSAGVVVNEQVAQNISTFYACVTLRAQTLATMPVNCYRRGGVDKLDKELADQHPSNWIWNNSTDDFLTSFNARESAQGHVDIRGNSFFEIGRNFRGQALKCWLLDPRRMHIEFPLGYDPSDTSQNNPNFKIYKYDEPGYGEERFGRDEIMHVTNWSSDGLQGLSPLTLFRETLGLTIAANRYTAEYFRKGGRPLGFLTKKGLLNKPQRDSIREEWQELHGGVENAHQIGILSGDMDWKNIGLTNNDAQLLGLRTFQRYLIAEIMRVPPFLLGDVEQTMTSLEFVQLQFIMFTMLPLMKRWEQEMNRVMFTPKEKFIYFLEHDPEVFLRGDQKTMAEVDQIAIRNAWSTVNEVRRRRNKKGVEYGDEPLVMASQMATLENVALGKANLDTTGPGGSSSSGSGTKPASLHPRKQHKSDQSDSPSAQYENRIANAYARLPESKRKKVLGMLAAMNGVGDAQGAE